MKQWVGMHRICPSFTYPETRRKRKLSKRDGDKFGFPVFPLNFTDPTTGNTSAGYREEGYLPGSFHQYGLLCWDGLLLTIKKLSMDEMIKEFDLNKVHKARGKIQCRKSKMVQSAVLATDIQ